MFQTKSFHLRNETIGKGLTKLIARLLVLSTSQEFPILLAIARVPLPMVSDIQPSLNFITILAL